MNLKAIYEFTFQFDSADVDSKHSELFILEMGKFSSKFHSYNKYLRDSLIRRDFNSGTTTIDMNNYPKSKFFIMVYKDSRNNETVIKNNIVKDKYKFPLSSKISWKLSQNDSIIKFQNRELKIAYRTYKGRNYTAYYDPKTAINYGPYVFSNLPGLIYTIFDDKKEVLFELKEIEQLKKPYPIEFKCSNCFETTQKEFLKMYSEFLEDPINKSGVRSALLKDPIVRERIKERFKRMNNTIELINK